MKLTEITNKLTDKTTWIMLLLIVAGCSLLYGLSEFIYNYQAATPTASILEAVFVLFLIILTPLFWIWEKITEIGFWKVIAFGCFFYVVATYVALCDRVKNIEDKLDELLSRKDDNF
ncbi:MAG: hypothetical protein PHY73_02090 [Candidatus Omnitrophica bacterium]|nr:hypothetical protein [Candidatus Omnitrophota bacterium]